MKINFRTYRFKNFLGQAYLKQQEFELNCNGAGSREDPIIIEPTTNPPEDFTLYDSTYHILIRNCDFFSLGIVNSLNITIDNCTIQFCEIKDSLHINIKRSKFESLFLNNTSETIIDASNILNQMKMKKSNQITIKNSDLTSFFLKNCFNNSLLKCSINKLKSIKSTEIIFDKCIIPRVYMKQLRSSNNSTNILKL